MKKIVIIMLAMGVTFVSLSLAADLPIPFQKLKEVALTCKIDQDGDYIWEKESSAGIYYSLGYFPEIDGTAIGKREGMNGIVILWSGKEKQYQAFAFQYGRLIDMKILDESKACENAYRILREMVEKKIY